MDKECGSSTEQGQAVSSKITWTEIWTIPKLWMCQCLDNFFFFFPAINQPFKPPRIREPILPTVQIFSQLLLNQIKRKAYMIKETAIQKMSFYIGGGDKKKERKMCQSQVFRNWKCKVSISPLKKSLRPSRRWPPASEGLWSPCQIIHPMYPAFLTKHA